MILPQVQEIVEILEHDDVGVDEQELVEGPQKVASLRNMCAVTRPLRLVGASPRRRSRPKVYLSSKPIWRI